MQGAVTKADLNPLKPTNHTHAQNGKYINAVQLRNAKVEPTDARRQNSFTVAVAKQDTSNKRQIYEFIAASASDRDGWVAAMAQVISDLASTAAAPATRMPCTVHALVAKLGADNTAVVHSHVQ